MMVVRVGVTVIITASEGTSLVDSNLGWSSSVVALGLVTAIVVAVIVEKRIWAPACLTV